MCLIVFAWQLVPNLPLVLAANRDEFYARPALAAHWWHDHPAIYAGRDVQAGGTWLGTDKRGRFAALTNIRNGEKKRADTPSRGALVADYLRADLNAHDYLHQLTPDAHRYEGFNLIHGDATRLFCFSNERPTEIVALVPGIYGVSNGALDTPWPKVVRAKAQFASLLCQTAPDDAYFEMLTDATKTSDCRLPKTGVSIEWERLLSSIFIESPDYGTRVSSLLRVDAQNGAQLLERLIR